MGKTNKRWRANENETFYYITESGGVLNTTESFAEITDILFNYGNYFKTKESAKCTAKAIKEIININKYGK